MLWCRSRHPRHRTLAGTSAWLCLALALSCSGPWLAFAQEPAGRGQPAAKGQKLPPKVPDGVVYRPDLPYHTVGKQDLELDLAYPKAGKGPFPAVVILHGTGLITKGRKNNVPLALDLGRRGFVGVAVSFRHKPDDPFPGAIEDVKCAVRWLRAHARKFRIDPDRIGALGYSGGGCLACLLGMATPKDGLEGKGKHAGQSSAVQA